ncbi:MAG TPA: hypothetical protein VGD76_16830 [Ramlibacter sp.]
MNPPTARTPRPACTRRWLQGAGILAALAAAVAARAAVLDSFGPPPPDDPSAFTDQPSDVGSALERLFSLPHTFEGAMELPGGQVGTKSIIEAGNVLPPDRQTSYNYPTNGYPSPLFGAQPYTQKLLMFEEFGIEKLDPSAPAPTLPFPRPGTGPAPSQDPSDLAASGPDPAALDAFLKQKGIAPFPTEWSNTQESSPWKADVEGFLGRPLATAPAEGRPPGRG